MEMDEQDRAVPRSTRLAAWRLPKRPWAFEAGDVLTTLRTDPATGLSVQEARARLADVGPNELLELRRVPTWRLVVGQFTNTMIVVLMVAAVVTAFIGDVKDAVVILAIVVLNGIIGFVQEYRADRAMAALKEMTSPTARVVREATVATIPAAELVPGDIVRLEAGDIVPADLRLVEVRSLQVNEAALTGESEPATKTDAALPSVGDALLADQRCMAFKGTSATYGRGSGVVVATGMGTALGRIADLMQEHAAGQTPLQIRLSTLGKALAGAALVICLIVFALGVARGESVELMFLTAVSLAVAAIPEALPAVVTISLALGAQRMAHRRALVRKLPAVETLGSVTVVCSDKTGTLTQNQMLAERLWTPDGEYVIAGVGYEPVGAITGPTDPGADRYIGTLARVAAACNDAILHAPRHSTDGWSVTGDPTEGALLALAGKLGITRPGLEAIHPRTAEIPFDAGRRRMCTLHEDEGGVWVAVKGALEALASLGDPADGEQWERATEVAERYAATGYRVLALAEQRLAEVPEVVDHAERHLHLLGLVGLADPPRPESADAVAAARQAGITPVLITGDHPRTAEAVARRVGILSEGGRSLTGAELEGIDEAGFGEMVADVAVYARTNPEQKLRIVEAWQRRGAVVAMTGDGVNDAPALKRADIGVAMGITGTQVSQEAADMVLADDNFATIVAAVEEGRRIYDNIRRFVRYALTSNSGEIWTMVLAPLAGLPIPLLPVHILWINLVTDGLPGLALGVEPAEPDTMRRPPRPMSESIFARGLWQQALWLGLLMGVVTLSVQASAIAAGWHWQTMVFSVLAFLQLGNALSVRSERESFFHLGWRTNVPLTAAVVGTVLVQLALIYLPPLQAIFATQPLSAVELGVVFVASSAGFLAPEIEKWIRRRGGTHPSVATPAAGRPAPVGGR
jgi:P-type Ca2+ transporter type 2C